MFDRARANEILELVVIDQSSKARKLLLDKLEECTVKPAFDQCSAVESGGYQCTKAAGHGEDHEVAEDWIE